MKIVDKINAYLGEKAVMPRKQVLQKVFNTIKSAKTEKQLDVAWKMAKQYQKQYGNLWDMAKLVGIEAVNFISGNWDEPIHDLDGLEKYFDYRKELIQTRKGKK